MQSTSQLWKSLFASGAALQARAVIGETVYTDISAPVISRATMQDHLAVGNVVSASLTLAVRGALDVARSAAVVIETRLSDGQAVSEWLPQGTFYISRRMRDPVTGLLALECYDALLKANAVWTPSAGAWPRTLAAVTGELAALLGVTLDGRTAIPAGAAYAMEAPAEGTTIRDALSLIAQAAGGNWIMTPAGRLRLVRLGEDGDAVDVAGAVGGIDVGRAGAITGVRSTVDGVVTLTGDDDGIVVDVAVAPMIAAELAETLIGQRWQPFRMTGAIYDPAAELGDGVRAGAGGEVASALCSEQAAYGPAFRGDIAAPDPGEITDEYPYIGSANRTLALAKAAVTEAVDQLDDALSQQEIFNRLTNNGAAQGLVMLNGQLYINAGYINAGMLNVERINFNGPSEYFSVPDESGPSSLFENQAVEDGYIVDTTGRGIIRILKCDYAAPLRGMTVAIKFSFRTALTKITATARYIGNDAHESGWTESQTVIKPDNPYTWNYTVPDESDRFYIAVYCDGVRSIDVTISGTVVPENSIGINYAGLRVGDFSLDRDGGLISSGKSIFYGPTRFFDLYLDAPLPVASGGTGAKNASDARANLQITPANIGAKGTQSAVSSPTASGTAVAFIDTISQNTQGVITPTKKTVASATQSAAGLMSAADKKKMDGIASGATANAGTVTSVATGAGLTGGTIIGSGTVKANLTSETKLSNAASDGIETSGRVYPVRLDKNGKLAVNVPWVDTNTQTLTGVKGSAESSYRTGNVNLTPANIGALPANNVSTFSINNTSQTAFENALKTIFQSMSDGQVRIGTMYANWSGSFTKGGRCFGGIYRHSSTYVKVGFFDSNYVGFYNGSTWTWSTV